MASASANAVDLDNPPVNSSSVAADTATHRASTSITSVHTINSARPDPEALPLTSFPAPSTAPIHESDSADPTLSAPMSEDVPALQEDPGPARADPDEVSEALARPDQDGVSATPALVGSGDPSNANPQET